MEKISHEITLFAEPVFHFGSFTVTNALVTSWFAVAIIVVLALALRSKLREVPGKIQSVFEVAIEGALSLCDQVTNDRKLSLKIFPFAISVFFFILVNNWLGITPLGGFGIIEKGEHGLAFIPYLRSGTADINGTIALAIMAVLGANIFGVFSVGLWKTFNKYVNLKVLGEIFTKLRREPTIIIVAPITFFVGLIEIVGEFAKIASFWQCLCRRSASCFYGGFSRLCCSYPVSISGNSGGVNSSAHILNPFGCLLYHRSV